MEKERQYFFDHELLQELDLSSPISVSTGGAVPILYLDVESYEIRGQIPTISNLWDY